MDVKQQWNGLGGGENTGAAKTWTSLATSADGVTMIAAAHSGNLWISNNSGANGPRWNSLKKKLGGCGSIL